MDKNGEAPQSPEPPKGVKGNIIGLLEKIGLKKVKEPAKESDDEETKNVDFSKLPKSYKDALKKLQTTAFPEEVRPVFARIDALYPGKYDTPTLRALVEERNRLINTPSIQEDLAKYLEFVDPAIEEVGDRLGIKTPEQLEAALKEPVVEIREPENPREEPTTQKKDERPAELYAGGIRDTDILDASHAIDALGNKRLSPGELKAKAEELQKKLIEAKQNLREKIIESFKATKQTLDDGKIAEEVRRHGKIIERELNILASKLPQEKRVETTAHRWDPADPATLAEITLEEARLVGAGWPVADARDEAEFRIFKNFIDTNHNPGQLGAMIAPVVPIGGGATRTNNLYLYLLNPTHSRARDYLFHKIVYKVLTQRNRTSGDLYELEDRRDMSEFLLFVREVGKRDHTTGDRFTNPADVIRHTASGEIRGRPIGDVLVENYEFQQDAINQSHDVDYWAAHAAGEMRQFQGSVAFYKNEYGEMAASDPVINAAYRAYEQALLMIKDSHNGYIPPAAIGYDPNNQTYYWDHLAEDIFKQYISNGVVSTVEKHGRTGLPTAQDNQLNLRRDGAGNLVNLREGELDDLEIKRILKLAKGYGVVSMRLLEIFANSRGPGSNHPKFGSDGFHSIPYEGMARHMQPLTHLFTKWKNGDVLYNAFFQQILDPSGRPWNASDINRIRQAAIEGRLEELYPGAKRLIDQDNMTNFSGAFGPWTQWRLRDAMKDWNERDQLWLGGSMRMAMAKGWAQGKVDEELGRRGIDPESIKNPEGMDRMMDLQFHSGPYQEWYEDGHHGGVAHGHAHAEKLARAHNAMVWLQMVEWNPLLVARNLNLRRQNNGGVYTDVTLRHQIIERLLGINLLRQDYRDNKTPNDRMRKELREIAVLEADVAAVRERLINGQEHPRAVELSDIMGPDSAIQGTYMNPDHHPPVAYVDDAGRTWDENLRRERVKRYFEMVHEEVTGELLDWGHTTEHTQHAMEHIGVYMVPGDDSIHINWNNILGHDSDHNIEHLHSREDPTRHGLQDLVFRERNWLEATDDTSWRQLDLLNLGARQFLRRAGDLGSHAEGNQELQNYLNLITGKPDMDKLLEQLHKAKAAYGGDDVAVAWKTGYLFTQATGRLFEARIAGSTWLADTFPGRVAMMFTDSCIAEQIYGHHHADNWTSNERRKWVDKIIDTRLLPPDAMDPWGNRYEWNAHRLQRELDARDVNVIWETVTMGIASAALLVLITALLNAAKGEEGGGGGHGGHGH